MKTHDELVNMTEEERTEYYRVESERIISSIPDGPLKRRLIGLQWELSILRATKYKNDQIGYLVEVSRRLVAGLGDMQDKFGELKELINPKFLDLDKQ